MLMSLPILIIMAKSPEILAPVVEPNLFKPEENNKPIRSIIKGVSHE
jgi:hypothetical protein